MATHPSVKPISRRELATWGFRAALPLTLIVLLGVAGWRLYPAIQNYDLGSIDKLSAGYPIHSHVITQNGQTVPVWVVHTTERWFVFAGRMKISEDWNCEYKWVPINNRFEDPCSGFKWALTGELLTYFSNPATDVLSGLRDLDQYAASLKSGHLMINLSQFTSGVIRTEPPPQVSCTRLGLWPTNMVSDCAIK